VFVHRDFHSRNLMVCPEANPGIIDFQDAVRGSCTYDLVSLLRDSYIAWPQERVVAWALQFRRLAQEAGLAAGRDDAQFLRWFDLMACSAPQGRRHIRRLCHRECKAGYLPDVPHTLDHRAGVFPARGLAALGELVGRRVLPGMRASLGATA
jgi:aminoglycoside/choline kinase family phosphotransferase